MDLIIDLLKAIAALLWPVLFFAIIFMFRKQIKEFLRRLKKGKILGQEVELEASLTELNATAVAAAKEVSLLPPSGSGEDVIEISSEPEEDEILRFAATSPKAALLALSGMVERETRDVLAASGTLGGRSHISFENAVGEISGRLPRHIPGSLRQFNRVRNTLVHGRGATDDDVLRAIDSGITILRALQAIPRQIHVVHHPGVVVYSDPGCRAILPDVRGVILESTSPGGAIKSRRIFATTKDYYEKGQQVTWEWSLDRKWEEAWYYDPETSNIRQAWHSSAEFIGRPLDTI